MQRKISWVKSGLASLTACLVVLMGCLSFVQPSRAFTLVGGPVAIAFKSPFSFSGTRPNTLGIQEGTLAECPSSPNCVSSQSQDLSHAIAPLTFHSKPEIAFAHLKAVIESLPRSTMIQSTPNYLYAEFASTLMGFVDDVEFYLDPDTSVIQVRSASRLGESDLGVNRQRIETVRTLLNASEGLA
jgi:uncharacterized protein (DUF1499 family)